MSSKTFKPSVGITTPSSPTANSLVTWVSATELQEAGGSGTTTGGNWSFGTSSTPAVTVSFVTSLSSGQIQWLGSVDRFTFADDVFMSPTERIYFGSTNEWIYQRTSGVLAIDAGTTVEIGHDGHMDFGGSGTAYSIRPQTTNNADLGTSTKQWRDLFIDGTAQVDALRVDDGSSTTISTGVGSVKMSSANAATNAVWLPINVNGTVYYFPVWTTNSP